jgi:DNA-binding CsgD family transcriptional regulator/PAS domain-containing protein
MVKFWGAEGITAHREISLGGDPHLQRSGKKQRPEAIDRKEEMGGEEFSELIWSIYDTALDPGAWPVMLNRLADVLSAQCSFIGSHNSSTNAAAMTAPRIDPHYLSSFTEYWVGRDFIWKGGAKLPVGTVMVREMIISRSEFCRTDLYNEWCKPPRLEAAIATNLVVEGSISTVIAAYRPYAKGDFDATETSFFAALIPHLQRAVQLQLRLAGHDGLPESSAEILNRLRQGVLLVDGEARVIFANRAAESILRAGRGLFLGRDGLQAEIRAETPRLRRIIADCVAPCHRAGGRLRLSREDSIPLTVLAVPHRARFTWMDVARPRAILFVTDPEATVDLRRQWLGEDFELTPAEAAVTAEVLEADGLQAAAVRLGISLATARTHLAHVFDKTGTRRQAQLVRLLLQRQPGVCEG